MSGYDRYVVCSLENEKGICREIADTKLSDKAITGIMRVSDDGAVVFQDHDDNSYVDSPSSKDTANVKMLC